MKKTAFTIASLLAATVALSSIAQVNSALSPAGGFPQAAISGLVNLATQVTGVLPHGNGGTDIGSVGADGNVLTASGGKWVSAAPAASGSPGGSNTQVQFNNSGSFGGGTDFTFGVSGGTSTVTIGNALADTGALVITGPPATSAYISLNSTGGTGSSKIFGQSGTNANIAFTFPQVTVTEVTAQPGANGAPVLQSTAGARSFPIGAAFTSNTLTLGVNGGSSGNLALNGSSSGSITFTAPATVGGGAVTFTPPTVTFTGATVQATNTGNIPVRNSSGAESFPTGAAFTNSTLTLGVNGGTGGSIPINGATSGTTTISVPAAAGSVSFILPKVAYTGAISQATATANIPIRNTSGVESFPAGLLGAANSLTVGAIGSSPGTVSISSGIASGVTNITTPSISASTSWVTPAVAVTEVAAQPGANGAFVTQSTAGVRATQSPNGSSLDTSVPTAKSGNFSAVAGTTYSVTGTITATMPTAVGALGQPIMIYMPGTSVMTVNTTSAQTFGGSASGAKSFTSAAATPILLRCNSDNVNWHYTQGL